MLFYPCLQTATSTRMRNNLARERKGLQPPPPPATFAAILYHIIFVSSLVPVFKWEICVLNMWFDETQYKHILEYIYTKKLIPFLEKCGQTLWCFVVAKASKLGMIKITGITCDGCHKAVIKNEVYFFPRLLRGEWDKSLFWAKITEKRAVSHTFFILSIKREQAGG